MLINADCLDDVGVNLTKALAHNHEVLATEREPEGQAKRSKAADADFFQ